MLVHTKILEPKNIKNFLQVESKYRSFPGLLETCWRGGLKQRKDARIKAVRNLEKILLEEIEIDENIF